MKILIIFFYTFSFMNCLKHSNFCYYDKMKGDTLNCQGIRYNLTCGDLCAKDKVSCDSIELFRSVRNLQKYDRDYLYFKKNYESFMNQIKDCPERPKYKWNSNDVCLNAKNCFKMSMWSIHKKPDECKCGGKYNIRCNGDYCAVDKRVCGEVTKKRKINVKKC
jgi:hypothetical protein